MKEKIKTISKNDSAINFLAERIITDSRRCTNQEKEYLEKFAPNKLEYQKKYLAVLFEFIYFFLNVSSRIALKQYLKQYGYDEATEALGDFQIPLFYTVGENLMDKIFENDKHKSEYKIIFINRLQKAIDEYRQCEDFILKTEDDVSYADKVATGIKSRGEVNLLADNVMAVLDNHNPITYERHKFVVLSILKLNEYINLVQSTVVLGK